MDIPDVIQVALEYAAPLATLLEVRLVSTQWYGASSQLAVYRNGRDGTTLDESRVLETLVKVWHQRRYYRLAALALARTLKHLSVSDHRLPLLAGGAGGGSEVFEEEYSDERWGGGDTGHNHARPTHSKRVDLVLIPSVEALSPQLESLRIEGYQGIQVQRYVLPALTSLTSLHIGSNLPGRFGFDVLFELPDSVQLRSLVYRRAQPDDDDVERVLQRHRSSLKELELPAFSDLGALSPVADTLESLTFFTFSVRGMPPSLKDLPVFSSLRALKITDLPIVSLEPIRAKCPALRSLKVLFNTMSSVSSLPFVDLGPWSGLETFHCEGLDGFAVQDLTHDVSALVASAATLKDLQLSATGFTPSVMHPDVMGKMKALELLYLPVCRVRRSAWSVLGGCTALTNLDASYTTFDDNALHAVASLPSLRALALTSCPHVTNIYPLRHHPELAFLAIDAVHDLSPLPSLQKLSTLSIAQRELPGDHEPDPETVSPITVDGDLGDVAGGANSPLDLRPHQGCAASLTRLSFTGVCIVKDHVADSLGALTQLRHLSADSVSGFDLGPWIRSCRALSALHLRVTTVNVLTVASAEAISSLPGLTRCHIDAASEEPGASGRLYQEEQNRGGEMAMRVVIP